MLHTPQTSNNGLLRVGSIPCGVGDLSVFQMPQLTQMKLPPWVVRLAVAGYDTYTRTIKLLPAAAAAIWIMKVLWPQYHNPETGKITVLVPSSGNFLYSLLAYIKANNLPIDVIGVISSRTPKEKRALIDGYKIKILTEIDLARELGRNEIGEMFEMLYQYGERFDIKVVDQYNCGDYNWNAESYREMAVSLHERFGEFAEVFTTAGSKGKSALVYWLNKMGNSTKLRTVYPRPSCTFSGGRGIGEDEIGKVQNAFLTREHRVIVDDISACQRAILASRLGFYGGITWGAEADAEDQILAWGIVTGKLEKLRRKRKDGKVYTLTIASDSIFNCLGEIREKVDTRLARVLEEIHNPWN